jgi:hypothetical protein
MFVTLEGKLLFEKSIFLASIGTIRFDKSPLKLLGVTGNTRISIGAYRAKSQQQCQLCPKKL